MGKYAELEEFCYWNWLKLLETSGRVFWRNRLHPMKQLCKFESALPMNFGNFGYAWIETKKVQQCRILWTTRLWRTMKQ